MLRVLLAFFFILTFGSGYAQEYPLSKSDSGIVYKNLEKYERLIAKDDFRGASGALNDVAFVYWNNNHYAEAATYYEKSLVLNERVSNENGIAMINNNLGMLYADIGRYEESLAAFTKTLAARRASKEPAGVISALVNISVVLNNLHQYSESIVHLSEAIDIARELYDKHQMRSVYGMLSETYEKMGEVEKSLQYFELYKSFHEDIQRAEIKGMNRELAEERLEKQVLEADKAKKEIELLKQQLEIYEKEAQIQAKDSINQSLYSNLSRKEVEIELLERDKELTAMAAAAREAENKKLQNQKAYLRNSLIITILAVVVIGILILINIFRSRKYNKELLLKNQSIEVQRRELEIANETKDRIFSIISHDLRSPIGSLEGFFFYVIDDFEMSDDLRKALNSVQNQLTNSASLVDNLLNWSRSQIKKEEPHIEDVEVAKLVEETFRLLRHQASTKQIELISNLSPTDRLKSDTQMVNIVVRNLVQNAIKFTPKGGTVVVDFETDQKGDCLKIFDNGIGMDEQKIASLFNISTNHSTLGTEHEMGSGLGLILCKELIEKVGGLIEVSSQPGNGTEFSLRFTKTEYQT
ncbi:MAG: tetratricopeptide repeat protein [Marinoscillum sp.]|uniref:ATP-binding protein n=1 Tax=Marinoscillum sp. TaxID=2024838 RepID=UPI0032F7C18E